MIKTILTQQVDQGGGVCALPRPARDFCSGADFTTISPPNPDRVHHPYHRRLDDALSDHVAGHHARCAKSCDSPLLIRFAACWACSRSSTSACTFPRWIGLDKFFDWTEMWKDVQKRRFITVGFAGFVLLIPLAVTSTAGWIRRLGGKRWQFLHRLVYITAVLGVIHYYWLVKSDIAKPLEYAVLVGILLSWRATEWFRNSRNKPAPRPVRRESPAPVETV